MRKLTPLSLVVFGAIVGVVLSTGYHVGVAAYRQSLDQSYNDGFIAGSESLGTRLAGKY